MLDVSDRLAAATAAVRARDAQVAWGHRWAELAGAAAVAEAAAAPWGAGAAEGSARSQGALADDQALEAEEVAAEAAAAAWVAGADGGAGDAAEDGDGDDFGGARAWLREVATPALAAAGASARRLCPAAASAEVHLGLLAAVARAVATREVALRAARDEAAAAAAASAGGIGWTEAAHQLYTALSAPWARPLLGCVSGGLGSALVALVSAPTAGLSGGMAELSAADVVAHGEWWAAMRRAAARATAARERWARELAALLAGAPAAYAAAGAAAAARAGRAGGARRPLSISPSRLWRSRWRRRARRRRRAPPPHRTPRRRRC